MHTQLLLLGREILPTEALEHWNAAMVPLCVCTKHQMTTIYYRRFDTVPVNLWRPCTTPQQLCSFTEIAFCFRPKYFVRFE
jgi:hypothetical protein